MPAKISKNASGGYRVSTPNGVHAKNATKSNAQAQQRLLNAIDHGFKPTGKPKRKAKPSAAPATYSGQDYQSFLARNKK